MGDNRKHSQFDFLRPIHKGRYSRVPLLVCGLPHRDLRNTFYAASLGFFVNDPFCGCSRASLVLGTKRRGFSVCRKGLGVSCFLVLSDFFFFFIDISSGRTVLADRRNLLRQVQRRAVDTERLRYPNWIIEGSLREKRMLVLANSFLYCRIRA